MLYNLLITLKISRSWREALIQATHQLELTSFLFCLFVCFGGGTCFGHLFWGLVGVSIWHTCWVVGCICLLYNGHIIYALVGGASVGFICSCWCHLMGDTCWEGTWLRAPVWGHLFEGIYFLGDTFIGGTHLDIYLGHLLEYLSILVVFRVSIWVTSRGHLLGTLV